MRIANYVMTAAAGVLAALCMAGPAAAQYRCTMPNGVKITQQLGACPRDAIAAERLDGTPVPIAEAQAQPAAQAQPRKPVPAAPAMAAADRRAAASVERADEPGGLSFFAWLLIVGLAVGLVMAMRGSVGVSGPVLYCTTCGAEGRAKTKTRGSLALEIVLWCFFLVPGLIYSIWRLSSKYKVCTTCGATTLVPLASPVAQRARAAAASSAGGPDR